MVKFTFEKQGRKCIGIGLSEGNIQRLKEKKPIHVFGEEINIPKLEILIMYGETEQAMYEELKEFIGPETLIHKEKKKQ